jgi:hypothetical protein
MKKLILYPAIFFGLLVLAPSCKKDDDNGPDGPDTSDYFHIVDNGDDYETGNLIKHHQDGFIEAGAPNSFTSAYAIAIPDTISPGTYSLTPTALVRLTKNTNSGSTVYTNKSGSMTISEHNTATNYIAGTFSGVIGVLGTEDTLTITGGEFRINYSE